MHNENFKTAEVYQHLSLGEILRPLEEKLLDEKKSSSEHLKCLHCFTAAKAPSLSIVRQTINHKNPIAQPAKISVG